MTDANLVLGRLPLQLAGGLRLSPRLAEEEIREKVARPLGLSVVEAAWAIVQVANSIMARALRLVTVEKGRDPPGSSPYSRSAARARYTPPSWPPTWGSGA